MKPLHRNYLIPVLLLILSGSINISAQEYNDVKHQSKVFGTEKFYRLYLPSGYQSEIKRYPVIYFFHGWGGRHYKDDNALLEYRKIKHLADKYQTILVMWDGSMDGIEPRPYNVGNHEDVKYQIQMKDYFPELVNYIDSAYRTVPDRNHRGIIGFSMGGFMALYLGGKYPDMVNSVVSLAGSPEFFVGYPENHTLYPVRYTFKNLDGINVQIHNGDSDILYFLNNEVYEGARWEGFPLNYRKFHGGHMVDKAGETTVFEMAMKFIAASFENPPALPSPFTHYDLYRNFNIRGYHVESNKQSPGFITLRNVHASGMGVYSQRWLPAGPPEEHIRIQITTPPVYASSKKYSLKMHHRNTGKTQRSVISSDPSGRLNFSVPGSGTEIGIHDKKSTPYITFLDYKVDGKKYLTVNQIAKLEIKLFNRGNNPRSDLWISIKSDDSAVHLTNSIIRVKKPENDIIQLPAIGIKSNKKPPVHAVPSEIKVYLTISSGKQTWQDDFLIPVLFDVPWFENITVDDGIAVRDTAWGNGNADGKANAGEKIMIYEGSHRLRLYTNDPFIISAGEKLVDEMIPAIWPDGFTLSSVIQISPDCPRNHTVECLASYETKTYNPIERKVIWGKVRIKMN